MGAEAGGSRVAALGRWFETPVAPTVRPVLVGGLAAGEIGFRSLSRFGRWAADSDAVPALGSLVLGGTVGPGDAAAILVAALYGYLVYVFTPAVFPEHVEHVTTRRGFRILTAINAVQFPVVAFGTSAAIFQYLSLVALALLPAYVVAVQGRSLFDRDGYPVAFMNAFTPTTDMQADYDDDADLGDQPPAAYAILGFLAVGSFGLTLLVVVLLGFVLGLLNFMYPVPEIVVMGWVGYRSVLGGRAGPDEPPIPDRRIDVEAAVVETTGVATQGLKGFFSAILAAVGLTVPVIFLLISVAIVAQVGTILGNLSTATDAQLLAASVGLLTVVVFAVYSVWYWLRLFSRLPHFLAAWRAALPREMSIEYGGTDRPLLARPPGWFVPPVLFILTMVHMQRYGTWPEAPVVPLPHLVVWTVLFCITAWTAYRGIVGSPQPPATDGIALPFSFLVEMAGAFLWVDIGSESLFLRTVFGDIPPERLAAAIWTSSAFGILLFLAGIAYLFYLPDVRHRIEAADEGSLLYALYFVPPVGGAVLGFVRGESLLSNLLLVVAVLFVLIALLVVLEEFGLIEESG